MLSVKQNLGPNVGGLAFRIETQDGLPRLDWEAGTVNLNANDVLSAVENREDQSARREAAAWLTELLGEGAVQVQTIKTEAKKAGLSWMTIRRAKESIGVLTEKSSYRAGWEWRLKDNNREDAHSLYKTMSSFEQVPQKKEDSRHGEYEDAQEASMSTFDRGQL